MAKGMGSESTPRLDQPADETISSQRVPKHAAKRRKLDFEDHDVKTPNRALNLQRSQLENEIEQGKKILHRALKVARGFERQKLGRRQKAAKDKKDEAESARLKAEVTALKTLDLSVVAETHLHKTLLKIKSIASAPAFPPHITASTQYAGHLGNTAIINVTARLYNSNPVKTAMPEVLYRIRAILGLDNTEPTSKTTTKEGPHTLGDDRSKAPKSPVTNMNGKPTLDSGWGAGTSLSPEWTGFSDDQQLALNHDDDDQGLDYSMYDARLAGSSDSDSEDNMTSHPHPTSSTNTPHPHSTNLPKSRSSSVSSSSNSPPPKIRNPNVPATASNSTFIPSLMGGYWSGSESAEDDDTMERNARKNRMGQQARRLLWEKKFGKKANHLKGVGRDEGWDPRKGAGGSNGRGGRGGGRGGGRRRDPDAGSGRNQGPRNGRHSSGANSDPVASRVKGKKEEGPLHPSWEAAKKAKEQKKNVAFQGKKVVFD